MKYNVNAEELKSLMFTRIMSRVISTMPGMETKEFNLATNGVVADFIGLNYEKVSGLFAEGGMETEGDFLLSGLVKSINDRVEKFMVKNFEIEASEGLESKRLNLLAYRELIGTEADEEKEEEDNPFGETVTEEDIDKKAENDESTIAIMISDLIKEIVKTGSPEVAGLAERVIELSKQNLENNKDVAEGDEDTFKVEKDESEDDDDDDKPKKKKKKEATGSSNPFEDGDNDDEASGGKVSNPFDDGDEGEEEENVGEENQSAKLIKELKCRSFGLESVRSSYYFHPFSGVENTSFNTFSKYIADSIHGEELAAAYNFGIESDKFKETKGAYVKTAREAMNASIASVLTAAIFNIPVESFKLNNVELFS